MYQLHPWSWIGFLIASSIAFTQAAVMQGTHLRDQQPLLAKTTTKSCHQLVQNYTALGDSYSAGLGAIQRFGICRPGEDPATSTCTTEACARDVGAFGRRFTMSTAIQSFRFLACNGVNTLDTLRDQVNVQAFGDPGLVTITIGGGDEGWFGSLVDRCGLRYDSADCDANLQKAGKVMRLLPGRFDQLFDGIRAKIDTANTLVVVLGYVRPWALPPVTECGGGLGSSSLSQRSQMNALAVEINGLLQKAALRAKFRYADVDARFDRHRVCDADESWLQEHWKLGKDTEGHDYAELSWMHPTEAGQNAYDAGLREALDCL